MPNQVGKRVKELRTALKMTQDKFAIESDLSPSTIQKAELGTNQVSEDVIEKIAKRWQTSEEWLRTGKGKMEFIKESKAPISDLYQDALYNELKKDKETWQQKYNELFQMFSKVLDRGGSLGKYRAFALTAGRKTPVAKVRVN